MNAHDLAVSSIATKVQEFYTRKEGFRIYHGSTNSTRKSSFERSRMVEYVIVPLYHMCYPLRLYRLSHATVLSVEKCVIREFSLTLRYLVRQDFLMF